MKLDKKDAIYVAGRMRTLLRVLHALQREFRDVFGRQPPKAIALRIEKGEAILVLRELCAEYGDNDWKDNAHLADILDKHLGKHLRANFEPIGEDDDECSRA